MSALDHRPARASRTVLPDGTPVTARPAGPGDLEALRNLAAREGVVCDELELARLLRSDPADRLVMCVTRPAPGTTDAPGGSGADGAPGAVIAIGVIERHWNATMPSLILAEPDHGLELPAWLAEVLVAGARDLAA